MKYAKLLVLALIAPSASLLRAEAFKLKNSEVIELHAALAALDGVTKVVPQGADQPAKVVAIPYEFSGKTRLVIARDVAALEGVVKSLETARVGLIKQISGGSTEIGKDDLVRKDKFFVEFQKVLDDMAAPVELTRLSEAELNLDTNAVSGSVLKVLLRIIAPGK